MSAPTLAVTGSTGVLGGMIARAIAAAGIPERLLVREIGRAPDLPGAVVVPFSYSDAAASLAALDGVETLFMVSASESAERVDQHRSFVDSAARAGVRNIVYTSFIGAAPDAVFTLARDHYATEEAIAATGMHHTFLRDSFYIDFMPSLVGDDDVIRGPAGDGRVAVVAREDVARAATAVLLDPGAHADRSYDLTGPDALSMDEVAAILSEALGKPISYHHETLDEAYESRRRWNAPAWQTDSWVSTYTAIGSGILSPVSDDIHRLTGLAPISLREFLARR